MGDTLHRKSALVAGLPNLGDHRHSFRSDVDPLPRPSDLQQSGTKPLVRSPLFIFREDLYLFQLLFQPLSLQCNEREISESSGGVTTVCTQASKLIRTGDRQETLRLKYRQRLLNFRCFNKEQRAGVMSH